LVALVHAARTAFFFCLMTMFGVSAWLVHDLTLRLGPQVFWFDFFLEIEQLLLVMLGRIGGLTDLENKCNCCLLGVNSDCASYPSAVSTFFTRYT
jgi:hypothetical protein